MIKYIVMFLLLPNTVLAVTSDLLKTEEPLSFEKFIFNNSLKAPIVKNLRRIKAINKEICDDDFSLRTKDKQICKFLFIPPNKIKIFKNNQNSEEVIIYYPDKDMIEY